MTSRPNLFHTIKIQGQVKKDIHAKNMKQYDDDDYEAYKYCELLKTNKWDKFISDPLNDKAKQDFLDDTNTHYQNYQRKRKKSKLTNIHLMQFIGKG